MEEWDQVAELVGSTYARQAEQQTAKCKKTIANLIHQRGMPKEGWSEPMIEMLLWELSRMDSNNFPDNVGVGEREGRVFCSLVGRRHYNLMHGIGRSGDVIAVQPKAAGSSLLVKLTNYLVTDAVRKAGDSRKGASKVVWPRMDQKSCLKAIVAAGFEPVVIDNIIEGDEPRTDLAAVEKAIRENPNDIAAVVTTSSCFAPRAPDKVVEISELCKAHDIPHVINNAYGIQSTKCMHLVSESCRVGRVDAVVSSTDKNFMVPVGGSIIYGSTVPNFLQSLSSLYPGRASSSAVVDVFATLLAMGVSGFTKLLKDRKVLFDEFKGKLSTLASKYGERVLATPNNPIGFGITLTSLATDKDRTEFGSRLFTRCCSGQRVVTGNDTKKICGKMFESYGAHATNYPVPYLTASCTIGVSSGEIDEFLKRLDKVFRDFSKQKTASTSTPVS